MVLVFDICCFFVGCFFFCFFLVLCCFFVVGVRVVGLDLVCLLRGELFFSEFIVIINLFNIFCGNDFVNFVWDFDDFIYLVVYERSSFCIEEFLGVFFYICIRSGVVGMCLVMCLYLIMVFSVVL